MVVSHSPQLCEITKGQLNIITRYHTYDPNSKWTFVEARLQQHPAKSACRILSSCKARVPGKQPIEKSRKGISQGYPECIYLNVR